MKRSSTKIWLAAISMAGLAGAPLLMGADIDGDQQLTDPRNNPVAPAAESTPGTIPTREDSAVVNDNRDRALAKAQETGKLDLISLAASNKDLDKFITAIQAAGLTLSLQGEGPYTIFAPSNKAFAKLGDKAWEDLMKHENQQMLSDLMSYHVVSGAVKAEALRAGDYATLQGKPLTAVVSEEDMLVNEGKIVEADLMASNGVLHIIDTVLMPPPDVPATEPMSSVNP